MLLDRWKWCLAVPGGRWLFARLLGWLVPYVGPLGVDVQQLAKGRARVSMRERWTLRNHLRSIHAVALVNLGELTANLALTTLQPKTGRFLVTGVQAEYLKKARGLVTCQTTLSGEWPDIPEGVAEITDRSGDVVCRVKVCWNLKG
jgi:hypothetical protein